MRLCFRQIVQFAALLVLAVLLSLAGGCGKEWEQVRNVPPAPRANAIVSLSPSTTEIVARWGDFMRLVGKTESCNWPPYPEMQRIPVVASLKPNYEAIAMRKPDVIVFDAHLYNDTDLQKLKDLNVDLLPFSADTIDEFIVELQKFGTRLGFETKVAEYADKIAAARSRGQADARDPRWKVLLLMGDMVAGTKSLYADMVRAAGGEPVGPDSNKWEMVGAEAIVQWNPDVVLVSNNELFQKYQGDAETDQARSERTEVHLIRYVPAEVVQNPKYQSLGAIKNKRIASVRADVIGRRGARVDVMIDQMRAYLVGLQ